MNNLIHFYEYSDYLPMNPLIYDELYHRIEYYESTLFGAIIHDLREFVLFCDLFGCLDSEL
jgi:hypothetical protein